MSTQFRLPGLNTRRLVDLMKAAVQRCDLDLSGYVVFTEAATGAYKVTPVLAALAGAEHVYALTRTTRYGTSTEVITDTMELATTAGVPERLELITEKSQVAISRADIITNSGHVRPIDSEMISYMKSSAVIPLMYETWELRDEDIDLQSCKRRGVRVVGTNEQHPNVDVFSFLGMMAIKLLLDAGVSVYSSRVLLLCDNPFAPYIARGLASANAVVDLVEFVSDASQDTSYDAILVASTPGRKLALLEADVETIRSTWPGAVAAIFWGDVDRSMLVDAGLNFWPPESPGLGHMGILPSAVGPEPIIRLQTGSLKAAEALLRYSELPNHPAHGFAQPI